VPLEWRLGRGLGDRVVTPHAIPQASPQTLKRMGSKGSALSGVKGQSPWPG
jgi:hypothetical protein